MKLGIDFGTTRIVVAAADRGNFPVLSFETADGGSQDWFPPLIAFRDEQRVYGWEAYQRQSDPEWVVVRSLKRLLEDAGPTTTIAIGARSFRLLDLIEELLLALKQAIEQHSSLPARKAHPLEVMLGVPANANTNQRFLTAEAFRRSGFELLGLLNEPSAAGIEYGHRNLTASKQSQLLLIYDLGGGTFDASLIEYGADTHTVVASEGLSAMGGDDFDVILAEMALEQVDARLAELSHGETFRLLEECRQKKEAIHPNTRKLVVDLGAVREEWKETVIPVSAFYERVKPSIELTLQAVEQLIARCGSSSIDCLYMTGGGSELPVVSRLLRERFGRKVRRSAYTRSATAIGLAIQAAQTGPYQLRDRFSRYFGVWREAEGGAKIVFDPLFEKGTPLPLAGEAPLEVRRCYAPAHNIGHFRYLECSHLRNGEPAGDITFWDEILFPFDPALEGCDALETLAVTQSAEAARQQVEECYRTDFSGAVRVKIRNLTSGYEKEWPLGRWIAKPRSLSPIRTRSAAARNVT